jgi:hypothetical protein
VGKTTWVALTPRTLLAGTSQGVRWALDRLQQGQAARGLPLWVIDTLQTPGTTGAVAADFVSQPIASASLGNVNVPWLQGIRIARVIGNLEPPGLNVAATITYGDPALAQQAASAFVSADRWLELFGPLIGGTKLRGFTADTQGSDVRCKFGLDTQGLGSLLSMVERLLPAASPAAP